MQFSIITKTLFFLRKGVSLFGKEYSQHILGPTDRAEEKKRIFMLIFGLAVRVFANGPGDLGSISGRVIPKTQKMVLDASLLNTQHYKVRIKGKVEPSREGVAPSPTSWCSSYRKGSLRVTLDYGRQLYLLSASEDI